MIRELEAVYERGVLRPLEPLALAEHQRVRLTLEARGEDRILPQNGNAPAEAAAAPVKDRSEEFQWLATESGPYRVNGWGAAPMPNRGQTERSGFSNEHHLGLGSKGRGIGSQSGLQPCKRQRGSA
jgi:predicted DNA-binding antitoxin AbrB/MazE fold protein